MSIFDRLFEGNGAPPDPAEATAEDVQAYTNEWLRANPQVADTSPPSDPTITHPVAKAEAGETHSHKAEYPWLFDPHRGVRWDFDPIALRNLAQADPWVGMLIQSITKEIAETSWTVTTAEDAAETQKRIGTHPEERDRIQKEFPDATSERIGTLLRRPNPDLSWHDMVEQTMSDLLEIGSTAVVKAFPRSAYGPDDDLLADPEAVRPRALQPTAPEVWTKDYEGKTGIVEGYWQFEHHKSPGGGARGSHGTTRGINQPTFFDRVEVMWDDMTTRTDRRYGMPPTLFVRDFLESLDLAVEQEQQYLSRGSIPSGAWVFEEWDREEVKEWKQENEENVKGKPHKSLMFAGRGGDVRYEAMSMNFQELEFTERMQWYAKVVSSEFQVPTAVVGLEPEKINYNTFQGERENFESNTLGPYLQQFERFVNHQLIEPHWGAGYRFEFMPGMSETTRKMISERVSREFSSGLRTRNEARREIGLDPVDDEEDGFQDEVVEGTDPEDATDALGDVLAGAMDGGADPTAKQETFDDYPEAAVENAQMALDAREDTGNPNDCGTDTGWARANQLANRETLSEETVRRMAAFRRHQGNADQGEDGRADCGWMMWKAWGGEEGVAWAERTVDRLDAEETDSAVTKADDALRNTDEWYQFDVQPDMVADLREEIADDVRDLFDAVLSDAEVQGIIDRLATEETEKSLSALTRRLKDLLRETDVTDRIREALAEHTASATREAVSDAVTDADADVSVDVDAIEARLSDREVAFADSFVNEMADDIRDTVAEGYAEGANSQEIADDIAEQADINEGWTGAERIARQELQIATGEARSEVAGQLDKVEVWNTAGDDRVRDAHQEMQGAWKRPGEAWEVEYPDRGLQKESVPGDSEPGIGCRCVTLLRDREEVDDADHAGDGSLN